MNSTLYWNIVRDVRELVAYPFMVHALEAGTIVAVVAGVAGWFMVLRRESFTGHTLSVLAFPGAAAAALAGLPLTSGYLAFTTGGAVVVAATGRRRPQRAATVGSVQAAGLALGFLLLGLYHGVLESLETLLFGSFLGVTQNQVLELLAVAAAALLFFLVVGRPLFYASVDEPGARGRSVPVAWLDAAFLVALALAVAVTAEITGALLVFALLVGPAAAAQQLTVRPLRSIALTVVLALLVTWLALALAYFENHSVGFFVTTLAFAAFVVARVVTLVR